jgi:hypothetical protein
MESRAHGDAMAVVEIVDEGVWFYGEAVWKPVWVFRANYDFWYEIALADGTTEPDEVPTLDEHGDAYYVAFRTRPADGFWPDDGPYLSAARAKKAAGDRVPGAIRWASDDA